MPRTARLIPLCLVWLFLLATAGCGTAEKPLSHEETVFLHDRYNSEYNTLMHYWGDFPDYYAGAYIRDNVFTILVTSRDPSIAETIRTVTGDPGIRVRRVRYSYAELEGIREQIRSIVFDPERREADSRLEAFVGLGIDEPGNRVAVEVLTGTLKRREVEEIIGKHPCVRIVYKNEPYLT